jgi:predicted N-acyltransferase
VTLAFEIIRDLRDISARDWRAFAGEQPFTQHAFLLAMQESGCASRATGWQAQHLLMRRDGRLAGVMLLYLKSHSQGEYVFDHAWAHAFERHGLSYYPKLLCAIPFSPIPGPRLLAQSHDDRVALAVQAAALAREQGWSSLHVLFPEEADKAALLEAGFMLREDVQFHWHNQGYRDFDDFLSQLNQKTRKKLRQDSKKVREAGVSFRWLDGQDIDDEALAFFYRCYVDTYLVRGRRPYLNLDFFQRLRRDMPDALFIVQALREGEPIACAFSLRDGQALYGRYWGSTQFVSGLHFETCYVQAIAYCIAKGLQRFEGGAQGEHKLSRGMLPQRTFSAHWIAHPGYAQAIQDYLQREGAAVERYIDDLESHSPFRQKT